MANTPSTQNRILELPFSVAVASAAAMTAVMPRDRSELHLLQAEVTGGCLYATDRYRCARYAFPDAPPMPDDRLVIGEKVRIPAAALSWVVKVKPDREKRKVRYATKSDAGYTVRYTALEDGVEAALIDALGVVEQIAEFVSASSRPFPPIDRLFDAQLDAPEGHGHAYDPRLLTPIVAWAERHRPGEPMAVRMTERRLPSATRPGTTWITSGPATFLVMPLAKDD